VPSNSKTIVSKVLINCSLSLLFTIGTNSTPEVGSWHRAARDYYFVGRGVNFYYNAMSFLSPNRVEYGFE
jgi:hypothetical protein